MITSIQQLSEIPTVFVLYYAGSSGEFLSLALSQCFAQMAKGWHHWENTSRVKFQDIYGRSFNSGDTSFLDTDLLLYRASTYLESHQDPGLIHIGMAHPDHGVLSFIYQHFANHPVIEITTHQPSGLQFRASAVKSKITHLSRPEIAWHKLPHQHRVKFKKHLQIEWQDLVFDAATVFDCIENFLNLQGDKEKFCSMVQQYKQCNKELLDALNENNHA